MAETVRDEQHAQELLGDVVVRCRRRSLFAVMDVGDLLALLIVVPMGAFFPLSFPVILLAVELGAKRPLWEDPIGAPLVGGWWLICCGLIVAFIVWHHRSNSLELREGGLVHNGRGIRFNEIEAIRAGRPKTAAEKHFPTLNAAVHVLNPGAYAARLEADAMVFTIIFRDGSNRLVYNVPKLFEHEDVTAFFVELNNRQPQYFLPPD
jgi:hypothetical protein